jgi:signal transduction histidine kinase
MRVVQRTPFSRVTADPPPRVGVRQRVFFARRDATRGPRGFLAARLLLTILALLAGSPARAADPARGLPARGLPFVRTYPLDEIGSVPRNLRLAFDSFGRIAVMYDGVYSVLNDTTWVDRMDPDSDSKIRMTRIRLANGTYYYGGRGSWGTVEITPRGHFRARPMVPDNAPGWTRVTAFNQLLVTPTAVYFYDYKGVVCWDLVRRRHTFFDGPRVATLFAVAGRTFAAAEDGTLRELICATGEDPIVKVPGLDGEPVAAAVTLDPSHALLALSSGRFVTFDGSVAADWIPESREALDGRVYALEPLVGGGVAAAINGRGVFLFYPDGRLRWAFTTPEFRRVGALAAGEPGVLWVAEENALQKILYDSPLTTFGQPLGLTVSWPKIAFGADHTFVCSNRNLYEQMAPAGPGEPSFFRLVNGTPASGSDVVAASQGQLLVGNSLGVFAPSADGRFTAVIALQNVWNLVFLRPDTCIAVGSQEIAALRYEQGRWSECAPRIGGVGDAPIRTMVNRALWIEMGADRVARLTLRDGRLDLQRIPLPWSDSQWTNVGMIGETVVLSGGPGQRVFYDEVKEQLCSAPDLDRLLARSPYWIARIVPDQAGTLWATHARGLVTFTRENEGYRVDAVTYELRNDSYPEICLAPDGQVWVTTGRSLYHVERVPRSATTRAPMRLVSVIADPAGRELLPPQGPPTLPPLHLDESSLSFRLFSGTYAWRHPPLYEYRLNPTGPWTAVDPSLLLHFPKLRDGVYRLEVRSAVHDDAQPPALMLDITINPPWHRRPASYAAYALLALLLVAGLIRWSNYHSLQRNQALERQVRERTRELERAMAKLGEETRNSAILAERSRLAGEFHDSVQQGLSGSILQLDSTLEHPTIPTDVRTRLNLVRRMLSYTREEVQQAVWNLASPLLQNANLGEALRTLAGYIHTAPAVLHLTLPPAPVPLDLPARQNLLRIAQEAITNAVKHSKSKRIEVTLQARSYAAILTVMDDGIGFDPVAQAKVDGHFGLRGLQARARAMKAELRIHSAPGHGTLVEVTVATKPDPHRDRPVENPPA